jgi:putative membrane protein
VPGDGAIDREPAPRFDEAGDATRRTRLANERTYLAWWRSGLTALAVALGAGKIVPGVTGGAHWPWVILGVLYAALGIGFIAYGFRRHAEVDAAIARGEYIRPDPRAVLVLTVFGAVIGVLTLVLVIAAT